jgi:hypothetical protein
VTFNLFRKTNQNNVRREALKPRLAPLQLQWHESTFVRNGRAGETLLVEPEG